MVSLKPLEAVGYNQEFFKLPVVEDQKQAYTWYTFDTVYPPDKELHWNLIGLRRRREKTTFFDVQWFYVDDDELSLEEYDPVQYASRFLSLRPSELVALIEFFEQLVDYNVTGIASNLSRFLLLDPSELVNMHFKEWAIDMHASFCYRYIPDLLVRQPENIILFKVPQWVQRQKLTQGTTLKYTIFERQQLLEPEFFPFDQDGLATITFTEQALKEFIVLLKRHTYEAALQAFQS